MKRHLRSVLLGVVSILAAGQAFGQRDLKYFSKNPFDATMSERFINRSRAARDDSRILYNYVETAPEIQAPVVQEQVQEISANLEKAKKDLAAVKADPAKSGEVMDCCKGMDKHLAKAEAAHKELKEKVAKGELDKEGIQKCCREICHQLDHATAEHDKMKKMINHEVIEIPTKK